MATKKTVTDAEIAAAAIAWGRARLDAYRGRGPFSYSEDCLAELYALAMRAAKERREEKP